MEILHTELNCDAFLLTVPITAPSPERPVVHPHRWLFFFFFFFLLLYSILFFTTIHYLLLLLSFTHHLLFNTFYLFSYLSNNIFFYTPFSVCLTLTSIFKYNILFYFIKKYPYILLFLFLTHLIWLYTSFGFS